MNVTYGNGNIIIEDWRARLGVARADASCNLKSSLSVDADSNMQNGGST